ncbi:MAG: DUF1674 domain-containing protein [Rhodospirillaceae bacterium]|nr:DUF1674 domain-containing protein [Rhodospirillaceae bacterium]
MTAPKAPSPAFPLPLGLSPEAAALKPKLKPESPGAENTAPAKPPRETGGPKGPEPTRFGDWERKGRCSDF